MQNLKRSLIIVLLMMFLIVPSVMAYPTNLKAYWKFDGGATDSTTNVNTGTVTGATNGLLYGYVNQGYLFDAISERIEVPHSASLAITGNMSFSFWMYPTSFATTSYVLEKVSATSYPNPYQIYIPNTGKITFALGTGIAQQSVTSDNAYSLNKWSFVTINRNGTSVYFYINGTLNGAKKTMVAITPTDSGKHMFLGNNAGNTTAFKGYLDEMTIWNKVLDTTDINLLYTNKLFDTNFSISNVNKYNGSTISNYNIYLNNTQYKSISGTKTFNT
jgi:hypothetical protein